MQRVLSLLEMIEKFEELFPNLEWTLARRESHGGYLASSNPVGFIAKARGPNPEVVRATDGAPTEAFEAMMLRTMRRYNVKQTG